MQNSIIRYNNIKALSDFRIDSEYWHPKLVANSKLVSSNIKIKDCIVQRKNILNIKHSPINKDFDYLEISSISIYDGSYTTKKIQNGHEPNRAHYILKKGDVVVSTVRPNRNAVAFIQKENIIGSSGLCVLRATRVSALYLYAFCKTNYFIQCLIRANKATMYPAVTDDDVFNIPIYIPSDNFLTIIERMIKKSFQNKEKSRELYNQAYNILLSELGLNNWDPKHQISFIERYLTVQQTERMDAEYFQPKYKDIIQAIQWYPKGLDSLDNLVSIKKSVEVGSSEYLDEGVPFVRVSNLSIFEITEEKYISEDLYRKNKIHQLRKGEILLSKDATPGIAHYIKEQTPNMIVSSGILRLTNKTDKVNNEYLTLVLNSILTQAQVNRDAGGSIILHWRPDQVRKIILPLLPKEKQKEIQLKVAKSLVLHKKSTNLLKCAKQSIETAITQDQQTAIRWLNNQTTVI